jgi:hypothetical protein
VVLFNLDDEINDGELLSTDNIDYTITYQILLNVLGEDLAAIKFNETRIFRLKKIKECLLILENTFKLKLCNRSDIVKQLFLLHQTARALEKHNEEVLQISYQKFRAAIYFPNLIYMLIRLLPDARKFVQYLIRKVYQEFNNKSNGLVNIHINSLYIDQDVIKSSVLYDFVGNGLKKFNPLDVGNIRSFYRCCFRSLFQYYFRRRKNLEEQELIDFGFDTNYLQGKKVSNRVSIYKDVLFQLHLERTQKKHTVLSQLSYNYQIFKNIIVTNEFQSIYQNVKGVVLQSQNQEYQLIDFFDDDMFLKDPELFEKLRRLPLIYKLLRCAHIQNTGVIPYNDFLIKPPTVMFVIKEELISPFKNIFVDSYVNDILDQIAKNFVKNILSGEYINLITFSTVKINHISFIDQLRKFVKLCLEN